MTLLSHPQVAAALDTFAAKTGIQRLSSKDVEALLTAILSALQEGEGLSFDIPEKRQLIEMYDLLDYDPEKRTAPGMQPVWVAAYDQALDRQHRAIVAALQEGEGLDFEAAEREGEIANATGGDHRETLYATLDRQHKARAGALRQEIATLRARVQADAALIWGAGAREESTRKMLREVFAYAQRLQAHLDRDHNCGETDYAPCEAIADHEVGLMPRVERFLKEAP